MAREAIVRKQINMIQNICKNMNYNKVCDNTLPIITKLTKNEVKLQDVNSNQVKKDIKEILDYELEKLEN